MEGGTHAYNLRKRKMVPLARSGMPSMTETMDGEQVTLENGTQNQNKRTSTKPGNTRLLKDMSDMMIMSGGEVFQETSLAEPLLSVQSDSNTDTDADSGVEISPLSEPSSSKYVEEASWQIAIQIFFPYIVAGFGMVAAGIVLDKVQHWSVFEDIPEVFILVPALLGLKGNLEMTLASRLSTQANIGTMDSKDEQWKMISGNLALTQAQAIMVGFLASIAAMVFGWIPEGKFNISHGLLLCASSVTTAAFASFILGSIMIGVVLVSRKCKVNPDNVATPIAASLGDLTTLTLLAAIASFLYKAIYSHIWVCPVILGTFLCLTPLWCMISHHNKYTNVVLYEGWSPVIGAMVISSISGLILDFAVDTFRGIAVFQPVINGVGGNLVAVQASRLSTALHQVSKPGRLPPESIQGCPNLLSTFFGSDMSARTARVLMYMVVPGHLVFVYTISYLEAGHTTITLMFALSYLTAALIQVAILLFVASWLVHWLWVRGNDPDNFSIPYLTALGDLLGTGLLLASFILLYAIGDNAVSDNNMAGVPGDAGITDTILSTTTAGTS